MPNPPLSRPGAELRQEEIPDRRRRAQPVEAGGGQRTGFGPLVSPEQTVADREGPGEILPRPRLAAGVVEMVRAVVDQQRAERTEMDRSARVDQAALNGLEGDEPQHRLERKA